MLQIVIENARKEAALSLKHALFNTIINNLMKEGGVKKKITSFTGDAKLGGVANIRENR